MCLWGDCRRLVQGLVEGLQYLISAVAVGVKEGGVF